MNSSVKLATILLVDDDETLRRYVRRLLCEQDFDVIEASDGAQALQVASARPGPIDLLLTDVIMPNVNGLLLAGRLAQERPGIAVVFISGYMESSMLLAKHPDAVLVRKPFTAAELVGTVRRVLESRRR